MSNAPLLPPVADLPNDLAPRLVSLLAQTLVLRRNLNTVFVILGRAAPRRSFNVAASNSSILGVGFGTIFVCRRRRLSPLGATSTVGRPLKPPRRVERSNIFKRRVATSNTN